MPAAATLGGARTAAPAGPARRMLGRSQLVDPHSHSLFPKLAKWDAFFKEKAKDVKWPGKKLFLFILVKAYLLSKHLREQGFC